MTRSATTTSFKKGTLFIMRRSQDPPVLAEVIATSPSLPSIIRCRVAHLDVEEAKLVILFKDTDMSPESLVYGKDTQTFICSKVEYDQFLALAIIAYLDATLPAPPLDICDALPRHIQAMISVVRSAEDASRGKS